MGMRGGEKITCWQSLGSLGSRLDSVSDWRRRVKEKRRQKSDVVNETGAGQKSNLKATKFYLKGLKKISQDDFDA